MTVDRMYPRQPPSFSHGLLVLLATGAVLDGVDRLGIAITRQVVIGAFGAVSLLTWRPHLRSPAFERARIFGRPSLGRRWIGVLAAAASAILLGAEVVGVKNKGLSHGFPVWLSDLAAEDNSSWIMLGNTSPFDGWLEASNFGYGVVVIKGLFNGLGLIWAACFGLPLESIGVQITAVGFAYIFLIVSVPALTLRSTSMVWERTSSRLGAASVGALLSLFFLQFFSEVRNLGHLSAGLTTFSLLYSVMWLTSTADHRKSHTRKEFIRQIDPLALWSLSLSCLLWFPLRPLSFALALVAARAEFVNLRLVNGTTQLRIHWRSFIRATLFLLVVGIRSVPDVRAYIAPSPVAPTRMLVAATGATYETVDFYLLLVAIVVGTVLTLRRFGLPFERLIISLMVLYVALNRFMDLLVNDDFQYGSTKMLWMLLPPLLLASSNVLIRDVSYGTIRNVSFVGVLLGVTLLLANSSSFFSTARGLEPLLRATQTPLAVVQDFEGDTREAGRWDESGGLDLRTSVGDLPIMCVLVRNRSGTPAPIREFEPYRCTRRVSEMSFEHDRPRPGAMGPALDILWKRYSLLDASLIEAVMGSIDSQNDLSRDVLILGSDEEIIGRERLLDFLAQVALSDPVRVSSAPEWSGDVFGKSAFGLERLDRGTGVLNLWVSNDVAEIILVGGRQAAEMVVSRSPRDDVADLLGADDRLSGLSVRHLAIGPELRCVVLLDRAGEGTVAWGTPEACR